MGQVDQIDTSAVADEVIGRSAEPSRTSTGYKGLDRRRPGRPQEISPHLVALLRSDDRQSAPIFVSDAQRAVIGLGAAVLLSVPLWAMVGVIAWALLG